MSAPVERTHATPLVLPSAASGAVRMKSTAPDSTSAPIGPSALLTGPTGSTTGAEPPLQI
ncbi:MAG: hypothetical protein IPK17_13780 [Chloroflexi bacterium]|nr:hypothetical protein [Chloroflexota bacterium]